ncbi:hypothetical protein [Nonomuraea roseoviolacea]|uniref:Uncharacterized protein n=1 Tax=Nonomuraea roseoviolacea subsp. carminata TaxID=160689 RepID=A0ABT1JVR7_9ACTN|nr:hypothetical protein [Nonomuraea roseoviolacea]MCP2345863.1 hypothetical protein [Nonomuraea roseoviolacea subsp. carminata]
MNEDQPVLELPDFDPKATRRSVRRGIVRTASLVLAVLVAVALAATLGSAAVQKRGDREERMKDVLGTAFKIYNPAYTIGVRDCCETTPLSMSFTVSARELRAAGGFEGRAGSVYTITQDFFGRVGHLPLGNYANTRLSTSLANFGTTLDQKEQVRKVLARLPDGLNALAVVEFDKPLTLGELGAFPAACTARLVYERRPGATPITWDTTTWDRALPGEKMGLSCDKESAQDLEHFRRWVGMLRDHDDANLRRFDLSLARLRKASADGLVYGYVDDLVTIKELRRLIEDPRVRTVHLADVTFDLDDPR